MVWGFHRGIRGYFGFRDRVQGLGYLYSGYRGHKGVYGV